MVLSKPPATPHFISHNNKPNPLAKTVDSRLTLPDIARRRIVMISGAILSQVFFDIEGSSFSSSSAKALSLFNLVAEPEPERTTQDAQIGIRKYAQDLLGVKEMMEKKLWREGQRQLRRSAANMKQDMYTIIQAKPAKERPFLRKLYSTLFNSITRLDYAARDEDTAKVLENYNNIVAVLNDIFSLI